MGDQREQTELQFKQGSCVNFKIKTKYICIAGLTSTDSKIVAVPVLHVEYHSLETGLEESRLVFGTKWGCEEVQRQKDIAIQ